MEGDGRPVDPAVVAAIVAALAAHLGAAPSSLAIRSVRPAPPAPAGGGAPGPWALAARLDLMAARGALLWRRR